MIKLDLVGQRFGRLVVVGKFSSVKQRIVWDCLCDCGKPTRVPSAMLRNGNTQSCGCMGIEARAEATAKSNRTHGKSKTPTYAVWFNMKRRCLDPRHKSFSDYGGRGIKVCDRWMDFASFLADMGERPSPDLSIERKDVNGNYEPTNCVWATATEQANNRRSNRTVTAFGLTMTVQQWSEEAGVTRHAIDKRLAAGWHPAKAVSFPMKPDRRRSADGR